MFGNETDSFVILSEVKRSRKIYASNDCIAVLSMRRSFGRLCLAQDDRCGAKIRSQEINPDSSLLIPD